MKSGDIVTMDKPTVHLWWAILLTNGTDSILVALDANTEPVWCYTCVCSNSKLTLDKKRRL